MKVIRIIALVVGICLILSAAAFASGDMPDTSMGGQATAPAPDNSTKAVDILGSRAAVYFEYGEDGYTVSGNLTDAYDTIGIDDLEAPQVGETYTMSGIYIYCGAEDWDDEVSVGNSGIVVNSLTDETTPFVIGGSEDVYEAPDGLSYNSIIIMDVAEDETLAPDSVTDTAPGVAIAFNGSAIELNNVYIESTGNGRPCVFLPASTRDANVYQAGELTIVDSYIQNFTTRGTFIMGGDVYVMKSSVIASNRGALVYDNTAATMYVVDSVVESLDPRGYSVYDAAGCVEYFYGIRAVAGGGTITVCRDSVLYVAGLEDTPDELIERYDGTGELLEATVTEDGRSFIGGGFSAIMVHADMAGADSQAQMYFSDTVLTTLPEEAILSTGEYAGAEGDAVYGSEGAVSYLQWQDLAGAAVLIRSHSGKLVFDNCELNSRTGIAVRTAFYYDSMANGIYPVDGTEYIGDEVVFANMTVDGDIIHDDYMRKMTLTLENAVLNGKVVSGTCASWNAKWETIDLEALAALGVDVSDTDEDEVRQNFVYNESYETIWGVRMSMDADSVWTVTGDSNLYSLVLEEGATIQAPEGMSLSIYVDCGMDGSEQTYDISSGTLTDGLEPGVEYTGVVILVA